jgi:8-oxo-dGTP diphosphatase
MTATHDLLLVVAAALVDPDGRVLIAQRPEGKSMAGLWEFPGGKIETSETPETALIRELREELGIAVKEPCLAPFTFASHTYGGFHLLMPLYICRRWDGEPKPLSHAALKWIRPCDLMRDADAWPMPAADLPLLPMLRDLL